MSWIRPFGSILSAVERLIDRALCVAGAVLFSQIPEFFQQYLQRLGGHLAEAKRQLDSFRQAAARSGWSLDRLIAEANAQSTPALARLGRVVADTQTRVESLAAAESAIRGASLWARPFVFLRNMDPSIARATLSVFRPAVPTSAEGLVYAAVGIVLALSLYHGCVRYPISCAWRARVRRKEHAAADA